MVVQTVVILAVVVALGSFLKHYLNRSFRRLREELADEKTATQG